MHAAAVRHSGSVRLTYSNRFVSCSNRMSSNREPRKRSSLEHLFSFFLSRTLVLHSFVLFLSRASFPRAPTKHVSCLIKGLFYSAHFSFYRERHIYSNLFVPCLSSVLASRPSPTHSFFSFFAPSHSLSRFLFLQFLDIYFRSSATHFEALRFRPHIAIVSGDRRFGNTSRREQLLINVILPAHF